MINRLKYAAGFALISLSAQAMSEEARERWTVSATDLEDAEVQQVLAHLPDIVACILDDLPMRCGIRDDDYLIKGVDAKRRAGLFADGPIEVMEQSLEDGDSDEEGVSVDFADGGSILLTKRGDRYEVSLVSETIVCESG